MAIMPIPMPMTMATIGMNTAIFSTGISKCLQRVQLHALDTRLDGFRLQPPVATRYTPAQYQARAGCHKHEARSGGPDSLRRDGAGCRPVGGPPGRQSPC